VTAVRQGIGRVRYDFASDRQDASMKKTLIVAVLLVASVAFAQGKAQRTGRFEDRETLLINFEGAVTAYFRRYSGRIDPATLESDTVIGYADYGRDLVTITLQLDGEAGRYVLTVESQDHDARYAQKWLANIAKRMALG
jgi:hypothetical protein